uniref:Uncharacterized protein n=1 Tax=Oryza glaberrima TaxID=4538 RepID=I1PJE2_ORYGL
MATVSPMVNLEHHGPAPEATDDPSSHVSRHIYVGLSYDVTVVWEMQLESVEAVRGVVGDEQVGGKILQLICPAQPARRGVCNRGPQLVAVDDDARHGAPQVAPPPGQRARLQGLLRREEGHDRVVEAVRQRAQAVAILVGLWPARAHRRCVVVARSIAKDGRAQVAASQGRTPFDPIYCM